MPRDRGTGIEVPTVYLYVKSVDPGVTKLVHDDDLEAPCWVWDRFCVQNVKDQGQAARRCPGVSLFLQRHLALLTFARWCDQTLMTACADSS